MGLFDKIKDKTESFTEKLQPKPAVMKVCMMGARGVGKTSVLTSMFHDLNTVNEKSNLQLLTATDPGSDGKTSATAAAILEKYKELTNMFNDPVAGAPIRDAGIAASFEVRNYFFKFGVKGRRADMDLQICDFPGEYIRDHAHDVATFIRESTAILVAIDTPHMMELDGKFCDAKNGIQEITALFRTALSDQNEEKLVLLIPLKCEKYYRENKMDAVTQAVMTHYADLIEFLHSCKRVSCAITPILTVGDVVFKEFLTDKNTGEIKAIDAGRLPAKAIYVYTGNSAQYNPKYCEQPLCYLLSFVSKLYERSKQDSQGFLKKLAAIFKLFPDDPTLLLEINRFSRTKVTDTDGYKILFGKDYI